MVVAEQVQHRVHNEMRRVIGHLAARRLRLARAGLPGDGDVAEERGLLPGVSTTGGAGRAPGVSGARSCAGQLSTLVGAGLPRKSALSVAMRESSQARTQSSQASGSSPACASAAWPARAASRSRSTAPQRSSSTITSIGTAQPSFS